MNTAPSYLFKRFFYRIKEFLRHWYVKSARLYWHFVISKLEKLDYTLAWKITIKNLFNPLYKDYSIIGYVLGFVFRLFRLLFSSAIYAAIFIFAASLFIIWALIPPAVLYGAITGQPIK